MTSRERVLAALSFSPVDRIPFEVEYGIIEFESDINTPSYAYGKGRSLGTPGVRGAWADSWGCLWEAAEDGVKGEVKKPLLESWDQLSKIYIPYDILEEADLAKVGEECRASDKFNMKMWGIEPFQRMQYLRGTENLLMDIAMEDDKILKLIDKVHHFYKTEVELWANTPVDAIHLEDDWGTQQAMLISPVVWRQLFKPLYKEYCDIAKSHNKLVVMHSDGYILDIIEDLIDIGVHAINPQLNVMPYEALAGAIKGKMSLWGGIDRQWLLPFGSMEDVAADVHRIAKCFCGEGNTGVVGQCFRDKGAKEENLITVYKTWLEITKRDDN